MLNINLWYLVEIKINTLNKIQKNQNFGFQVKLYFQVVENVHY